MCGIAGIWSPTRPEAATEAVVRRMADVLDHRGPDGRGVHVAPDDRVV